MDTQTRLNISYKDKTVSAILNCSTLEKSELKKKLWIVLTHGAGGDLKNSQLSAISSYLVKQGFAVLRFTYKGLNLKYRVKVFHEVVSYLHRTYTPRGMFIGGRSMGSTAAVMLSYDPEFLQDFFMSRKVIGVICLSYPLHKPRDPTELRDEPLKNLAKPVFFLSGTRDEMCNRDIFLEVLSTLKSPYKIQWLEGCKHSAKPVRNYEEDTYSKAFEEIANWCLCIGRKC